MSKVACGGVHLHFIHKLRFGSILGSRRVFLFLFSLRGINEMLNLLLEHEDRYCAFKKCF